MNGKKSGIGRVFLLGFLISFLFFFAMMFLFQKEASGAEDIKSEKDFSRLIAGEWRWRGEKDGQPVIIKINFLPKISKKGEILPEGQVSFSMSIKSFLINQLSVPKKMSYKIKGEELLLFLDNEENWLKVKIINLDGRTVKWTEIDNSSGDPIQESLTYTKILH